MKVQLLFSIIFSFNILCLCNKAEKILVVSDNTFNKTISEYIPCLVEFTADPCEHCWDLDRTFREIWRKNKEIMLPLSFIKINITKNTIVKERYNITNYPSLKFFTKLDIYEDYVYSNTEKEIFNWLKKKLNPLVNELSSLFKIQYFVKRFENCLLFYGNLSDPLYANFYNLSQEFINIEFISSNSKEVGEYYKISRGNLILFKAFSNKEIVIREIPKDKKQLLKVIQSKFLENLRKFDSETNKLVFNEGNPGIFLFRDEKHYDTRDLDILMEEIALELKGKKLLFVSSDLSSQLEKSMADMLGVYQEDMPMIRLFDTRTTLTKYKMDNSINKQNILQFIKDWENGTLVPYLKTAKPISKNSTSYMMLVSSNFEQIVNDETKDVLVLFCNQLNIKCKELESTYEYFSKKAHSLHNETLLITYIDNRQNELEKYKIYEVPHMKLYTIGKKSEPIIFSEKEFSYDNIIDFVAKYSYKATAFKNDL